VNPHQRGVEWLNEQGWPTQHVAVSKYYTADEAWPRTPVWWFEFPMRKAAENPFGFVNLLCTPAANGSGYHHLWVPMGLFLACKHHLGFRDDGDKFSLYLSAEESRLFRELRGDGQIEFGVFKVEWDNDEGAQAIDTSD
jgi:hypothetical protein